MDTQQIESDIREGTAQAVHRADTYMRENPVPTLIGALAVGFILGLLARSFESQPESELDKAKSRLRDAEDDLHSLIGAIGKRSHKAYSKTSDAVRDALEDVAKSASKIDIDDYTDPVGKWFRKTWKKARG